MEGNTVMASGLSFHILLLLLACCSPSLLALLSLHQRDTWKSNRAVQALLSGAVAAREGVSPPTWV